MRRKINPKKQLTVELFWQLFQKQSSAAEYKKTDAPQPDVKEEEKVEERDKGEAEEEDEEMIEEKPGKPNGFSSRKVTTNFHS